MRLPATPTRVRIDQILVRFFVRKRVDEDRVLFFAELYGARAPVEPIRVVTDTFVLLDGRHRLEAMKLCDMTEAECELVPPPPTEAEAILDAFLGNLGGSKPPTMEDMEHTIDLLLDAGMRDREIMGRMNIPAAFSRKLLQNVHGKRTRRRVQSAARDVRDGNATVTEAATKHGVAVDALQSELGAARPKKGKQDLSGLKSGISRRFKSVSLQNGALLKGMLQRYEDGELHPRTIESVIAHIAHCLKSAQRSLDDWSRRYSAMKNRRAL